MRRAGGLFLLVGGLVAGCGGSEPIGVQMTVRPTGCEADEACAWSASGSGILVEAAESERSDLSSSAGEPTLYAEAMRDDGVLVVAEVSFLNGVARKARYREVEDGKVTFKGKVADLQGILPTVDERGPVAGYFSFVAQDRDDVRTVAGLILPATGDAVRLRPDSSVSVSTETYVSCEGEVYVPPPDLPDLPDVVPDEPWTPDPEQPSTPDPETPRPTPSVPADSGCDDTTDPEPSTASDSGCEGDDYDTSSASDSGCEGDDYGSGTASDSGCEGDTMSSSSDSGCEGDGYDSMSSSSDSGCEGDDYDSDSCEGGEAAAAAVVVPGSSRIFASLFRLLWPVGLAGAFNRGARRRRRRA
ncbi:MAG: hypothetical protein H6730_36425 [Deltaproteobacteria bacterium]|nr:hypothetical protein [Deltaproteobacteria bacterium]